MTGRAAGDGDVVTRAPQPVSATIAERQTMLVRVDIDSSLRLVGG
jgi:hypothetical protein